MNIQEAEEILNATKLHLEWKQSDLRKLEAKTSPLLDIWELRKQIKEYKQDIERLTNIIEILRLKASIPVVNY
jgi:hypothetical protein